MKHNPSVWNDGETPWQYGYDEVYFDGIDTSGQLPCKCPECVKQYEAGKDAAHTEIDKKFNTPKGGDVE